MKARKPINKFGKKGKANLKNVAKLKKIFDSKGLDYCERCGSRFGLTFAHPFTRQHIKTQTEMETVARICLKCHIEIEGIPEMESIINELIASREERCLIAA